nr:methyl-accepting chemotaxis protein [Texcoconibacillus texcoconensis]
MILSVVVVVFTVTIGYVIYSSYQQATEQANEFAEAQAENYGQQALRELGSGYELAENLTNTFETIQTGDDPDRDLIIDILGTTLEDNEDLVGVWGVWEPDAFDGSDEEYIGEEGHNDEGRFTPYWNRGSGEIAFEATGTGYESTESEGDWYNIPLETGEPAVIEPTNYDLQGEDVMLVSVSYPINVEGETVGVVGVDFALDNLQAMMSDIELYDSGIGMLVSHEGAIAAHEDDEQLGAPITDTFEQDSLMEQIQNGQSIRFSDERESGEEQLVAFTPVQVANVDTPWSFATAVPTDEVTAEAQQAAMQAIVIVLVSLLVLAVLIVWLARSISQPIVYLSERLKTMANLDLRAAYDQDVQKYLDRRDEIGTMTQAVQLLRSRFTEMIQSINESSEQVAASSEELTAVSDESSKASQEIANTIEDMSKRATNQSDETEKGAQNVNELGQLVQSSRGHIQELHDATYQIVEAKNQGLEAMEHLTGATSTTQSANQEVEKVIASTDESAKKITKAAGMIQEITEQTNLLALNASIEAARAGEAGKGFAVVADEIRKLAEQSNKSTEDIASVINELTEQTKMAVASMEDSKQATETQTARVHETTQVFTNVADAIEEAKETMEKIQSSSVKMEEKSDEIVTLVDQLSSIAQENAAGTQEVSASVEEQTASMEEVAASSESLAKLAENLKESVAQFQYEQERKE